MLYFHYHHGLETWLLYVIIKVDIWNYIKLNWTLYFYSSIWSKLNFLMQGNHLNLVQTVEQKKSFVGKCPFASSVATNIKFTVSSDNSQGFCSLYFITRRYCYYYDWTFHHFQPLNRINTITSKKHFLSNKDLFARCCFVLSNWILFIFQEFYQLL